MRVVLKTDRLILRRLEPADAPVLQSLCGNWNVTRMLTRVPYPVTEAERADFIAMNQGPVAVPPGFQLAIIDAELIGVIGVEEAGPGEGTLGYWIGEAWWGRAYASEAARAVIDFCFMDLRLAAIKANAVADNPVSQRVLEKCGFRHTRTESVFSLSRGSEVAGLNYRLERADWRADA